MPVDVPEKRMGRILAVTVEQEEDDEDDDMQARCTEHYAVLPSVVQLLPQVINEGAEKGFWKADVLCT